MVQRLQPRTSAAGATSSIPDWGTRFPQALWAQPKINKRRCVLSLKDEGETLGVHVFQGNWFVRVGEERSLRAVPSAHARTAS